MLMTLGRGDVEKLKSKLISIGFHGNNVFQSSQVGVTTLMKEIMASFVLGSPTSKALYEFLPECFCISKFL